MKDQTLATLCGRALEPPEDQPDDDPDPGRTRAMAALAVTVAEETEETEEVLGMVSEFIARFGALPLGRQLLVVLSLAVAVFLVVRGAFVVRQGIRMIRRARRR